MPAGEGVTRASKMTSFERNRGNKKKKKASIYIPIWVGKLPVCAKRVIAVLGILSNSLGQKIKIKFVLQKLKKKVRLNQS